MGQASFQPSPQLRLSQPRGTQFLRGVHPNLRICSALNQSACLQKTHDIVRLLEETQIRLLEATERAHRAERQNDLLKMEVATTRNVLAEHAESLSEKEAVRRQQEELARERELERSKLEEENRVKQSLYEQEKQQWMMELETTKSRVDSIERRLPKWIRGLFGVS